MEANVDNSCGVFGPLTFLFHDDVGDDEVREVEGHPQPGAAA